MMYDVLGDGSPRFWGVTRTYAVIRTAFGKGQAANVRTAHIAPNVRSEEEYYIYPHAFMATAI